jgi:hypothetical protein
MRKLIALFALTFSALVTASASVAPAIPPDCGGDCPWVQAIPPDCGGDCPWVQAIPPDCGGDCPWVR